MSEALASLIGKAQRGDTVARDVMYRLAFHRLRRIAAALLGRERAGHTLQPTALVSELFLKLHKLEMRILNEDHFFRVSARAMRQVLIDHARVAKPTGKKISPELISELLLSANQDTAHTETQLAVKIAFEKLRAIDPEVADTVWRRSVEGLTISELGECQGRESWRVRADYDFGLQWMATHLQR